MQKFLDLNPLVPGEPLPFTGNSTGLLSSAVAPPSLTMSPLTNSNGQTSALLITATQSPIRPTLEVSSSQPLFGPAAAAAPPTLTKVVDPQWVLSQTKSQLASCGWYHGALSWQESNHLLANTRDGTFLLRDSQFPGCLYSLSVNRAYYGPTSIRIHFAGGKFKLDSDESVRQQMPSFSSVIDLVEYHLESSKAANRQNPSNAMLSENHVSLKRPLYKKTPTLAHLARISINKSLKNGRQSDTRRLELPVKILQYLESYKTII